MRLHRGRLVMLFGGLLVSCGGTSQEAPKDNSLGTAESGVKAVGPINGDNGFPTYYEDAAGVRLQPCLDGTDTKCILGATPTFNLAAPTVFTSNFPGEAFYAYAASDKVATPGCPGAPGGPIPPGKAFSLIAVEGAFAHNTPAAGDQIAFGRIRIVASGLCPNTAYDFMHPHGTQRVTTNALGQVTANIKGYTEDIGCKATPCNFSLPFTQAVAGPPPSVGSRVFNGFARWSAPVPGDPDITGYVGDGVTLHTIVGTPNNVFTIRAAPPGSPLNSGPILTDVTGLIPTTTANFVVAGKLAGDLTAPLLGFGAQNVGVLSAPRTVTVTNYSQSAMTVAGTAVAGVAAADYAIVGDTCTGSVVPRDGVCTITATFNPSVLGDRLANINVTATRNDGLAAIPLSISLKGTGVPVGASSIVSFDTAALAYGNVRVNSDSNPQVVTLTNTGNAPLQVFGVANVGANAADFTILQDTCSGKFIDAAASCFVSARVKPSAPGARVSSLVFTDDGPGTPHTIALSATGTGGLASRSPTVAADGFPDWYQDDNGTQLRQCFDQIPDPANPGLFLPDPLCILNPLPEPAWNPAAPLLFPTNFPVEAFYYAAGATLTTPGCPASGVAAGKSVLLLGVESTFLNGAPINTDQITFGRRRYFTRGLCPNTTYQFTTPEGVDLMTTDAAGDVRANQKIDTGCLGVPCAFTEALADKAFAGFLTWDPAVAPAAPPGYIGDPLIPHRVVGGTYTAPGGTTPVDYYEIAQLDGTVVATTNLWNLSGKSSEVRGAPQPVVFPANSVGTPSAPQTVTVTNVDPTNALTVTSVALGGTNPADYVIGADACTGAALTACPQPVPGLGLPPNPCPATSSCTVNVTFLPSALGVREAALIANHTGAVTTPMTVLLTGLAGTPGLSFNPGLSVAFDDQVQNTDSYPHSISVINSGTAPLIIPAGGITLSGANVGEFNLGIENCSGNTVPVGGTCSVDVTFSPAVTGNLAAVLNVSSNAPSNPDSLPLSGRSLPPAAGIASPNPTSIAFAPPVLRGTASPASNVLITNVGVGPLAIHHLAVVGQHAGDFTLATDSCTGATSIAPGASCGFSVVFAPTLPGARSGIVNIYDSTGSNTLATVALSGTGLAPNITPIVVPPFGGAAGVLFNTTVSQNVTITNSGDGLLIIPPGGITLAGAGAANYAITGTTCTAAPVAAGASCTATVAFTPLTAGVKTATLNIAANTVVPTTTASLTGTGLAPVLSFSANPLAFGNQKVGTTTTKGINITNSGTAPLIIGALGVRVTPAAQFFVVAGSSNKCTPGTTLQPGKNCSLNVTFAPTGAPTGPAPAGLRTGTLSANTNDPTGVAGERTDAINGNALP